MSSSRLPLLLLLLVLALAACTEETADAPTPDPAPLPEEPVAEYTDGHWAKAQRGVPMDSDDLPVVGELGGAGLTPSEITERFGVLVLNRPYVDWRVTSCADVDDATMAQPRHRSEQIVTELKASGVDFERIAVNVDLIAAARRSLLYVCFEQGAQGPRFEVLEHRAKIIEAFADLAGMDNMAYITVGLEMNRYYHLQDEAGGRFLDDYSNYVSLYREIYAAIKEVNSNIQVGPGISWAVLQNRTVPELVSELDLDRDNPIAGVHAAFERTVKPLLRDPGSGEVRADYIGLTILPFQNEDPFNGEPAPSSETAQQAILDYYKYVPIVSEGLPVALPLIDWPTNNSTAVNKDLFITTLKRALSHVDVEFASWRRLADLPKRPPEASPCRRYTEAGDSNLAHPEDFCTSGMVEETGAHRDLLDIFTQDP